MPWHTHGWFLALFYVCAFVWTGAALLYRNLCGIVFPSSAPPPRRQWSARYLGDGFRKPRLRRGHFPLVGKRWVEWMKEKFQTMVIFISLFVRLLSRHSLTICENRWFHGLLFTAVWSVSIDSGLSAFRPMLYLCVEINFPLVGWEWMTRFVLRPGRLGRDFPSTPILTEWRPLSLPSNRRPRG